MIPEQFRILLSNDDGIHADGIRALEEAFQELGEVWVVAPDRERSGTSQAISIRESLILRELDERHFSVNGYPVDCVNVAINLGRFPPFDIVVSGINHGYNLGDDVHYSGTVGAAKHAAKNDIRAVAVSTLPIHGKPVMRRVAGFVKQWVRENFRRLNPGIVYNINYPEEELTQGLETPYPSVDYTMQGSRIYNDRFEEVSVNATSITLRLQESAMGHVEEEESDFRSIHDGKISITPIGLKTTENNELRLWKAQEYRNERR